MIGVIKIIQILIRIENDREQNDWDQFNISTQVWTMMSDIHDYRFQILDDVASTVQLQIS